MAYFNVKCPTCNANVHIDYDCSLLDEEWTVEEYEGECDCGTFFTFDARLEILNKKQQEEKPTPYSA